MFSVLSSIHWLSVFLAFIAYFTLGPLWFVFLFPKQYSAALGKVADPSQKVGPIFIIGPMVCTLIVTLSSAVLLSALHLASVYDALQFAVVLGLGILCANTFNIAINPNIPRPLYYGLIVGSYHIVGFSIATFILVLMQ